MVKDSIFHLSINYIMGQSLSANYQHMVFSTKFRKPYIIKSVRPRLNGYLHTLLDDMNCPALKVNCVEDHVHLLFRQSKMLGVAKIAKHIKMNSSKWIKTLPEIPPNFSWQIGYGSFSVSGSGIKRVVSYIENQEEIHRRRNLKKEIENLVKEYNLTEYDEQYYWD